MHLWSEEGRWIFPVVVPEKQVELFDSKVDKEVFEFEVRRWLVFVNGDPVSFRRSVYAHSEKVC